MISNVIILNIWPSIQQENHPSLLMLPFYNLMWWYQINNIYNCNTCCIETSTLFTIPIQPLMLELNKVVFEQTLFAVIKPLDPNGRMEQWQNKEEGLLKPFRRFFSWIFFDPLFACVVWNLQPLNIEGIHSLELYISNISSKETEWVAI